ncbi:zinc-dependent alcohol dehydrogenase family protein [Croceivirga thetidis]|uniref:Zinc-dependent alcohol dehydrogenase family protein n=1 Tax=Croceivirga thetidis TaxID=2721623 RepID=A0ABX1GN10_9FLAO|nr:zinc-dependent alcohol dehydrogenase family protein [Croceivirga thetidis]NKI30441.1 zinc-dependent alcohol dehydrogenase family protein [Croceivirga thetidis]
MNKVARLIEFAGPGAIRITNEEIPFPGFGEVLVKMKTAGLNHVEKMIMYGRFPIKPELSAHIGFEGAGIIEHLGLGVNGFQTGDEVCIIPNMAFDKYGVIGNYIVVPSTSLVKKPSLINWQEASAIWMGFGTAYQGLVNAGGLQKNADQTVLISAASSSVGFPAIQIAKLHGAQVIATSRTLEKAESLKEMGADYVVATSDEKWTDQIADITSGKGFDIAFDPITGPFTTQLADASGFGAIIVSYGTLSMSETSLPLFPMLMKALKFTGIDSGHHLLGNPDRFQIARRHIVKHLENGNYKLKIDSTFPFTKVKQAYQRLESGNQIGKIIINIEQE